MNINELFEEIQNEFLPEELNGEFLLQGNLIIWSYNLDEDAEEIDYTEDDEDDNFFNFESSSSEELLKEAYHEDLDKLNEFLDELGETNWNISDFETIENIISFKIF